MKQQQYNALQINILLFGKFPLIVAPILKYIYLSGLSE